MSMDLAAKKCFLYRTAVINSFMVIMAHKKFLCAI